MSLGNGYRSTTEKVAFMFMFILSLFSRHLREPNNPHHLTPSVLTVKKTVKLSSLYCQDYNLAWSTSKAFDGWTRRVS